jgi:NAD(P)-dependent dehydrogenase (short-subunit alcohol dehydrogenase family)
MASKTWFITGTSTGFGRALTEELLARGDRVAATLRRPAALDGPGSRVQRPAVARRTRRQQARAGAPGR